MNAPLQPDDRTAQIGSVFQAIGHFFVEFSQLQWVLDRCIADAIAGSWAETLAVLVELTADPQVRAWQSVISQTCALSSEEDQALRAISNEIRDLIRLRNDWAHGHWFVRWGDESAADWSQAELERLKNTSRGVESPTNLELRPTVDYIEAAAMHVVFVAHAVRIFSVFAHYSRQGESTLPGDRVRVTGPKKGGRQLEFSPDGSTWRTVQLGQYSQ